MTAPAHFRWLLLGAALGAAPAPLLAQDGIAFDDQGLHAATADGDLRLRLGGKLHLDALTADDEGVSSSDTRVRRARIDARIDYADVLTLRAEREFAGTPGWRNLYAAVRPVDGVTVQAGQFTSPFSMEDLQSANTLPFPERSLASILTGEFSVGAQTAYAARRFTVRAGYFGESLSATDRPSPGLGHGVAGRATWLPLDHGRTRLHLGLALERRNYDPSDAFRYAARGGGLGGPQILRTPLLTGLSRRTGYGAELALLAGSVAVQANYVRQDLTPLTGARMQLAGGYAQASWLVTGQNYRYSRSAGIVSGPDLRPGALALELGARVSWIDAETGALDGGVAQSLDLSAGLLFGRNVRLLGSVSRHRYREGLADPVRQATVAATRLQFAL